MTHELILTSVSQGLEPNESGFCPVAADQSIPAPLVRQLVSLSNYRHLNTDENDKNRQNPVVYSHLVISDNGKPRHVLSRIADAGTDYRHQPNVLAHHITFDESEFVPEGPAWLLALPSFHLNEWLTPAVRFPIGRPLPSLTLLPSITRRQQIAKERNWLDPNKMLLFGNKIDLRSDMHLAAVRANNEQIALLVPPNSPCPAWQELTGDAGWGGILAETVLNEQRTVLLFKPGQNILPLFVEALSLLPPEMFWNVTFNTFFIRQPENVDTFWKGIVADSPEAEELAQEQTRNQDTLVIDLTKTLGEAPSGLYVEFARQGYDDLLPDVPNDAAVRHVSDSDTKPYGKTSGLSNKDESAATQSGIQSLPPITVPEKIKIKSRRESSGLLTVFLHIPSKGEFYALYSAAIFLTLVLLTLITDQVFDFGFGDYLRGERQEKQILDRPFNPQQNKQQNEKQNETKQTVQNTESDSEPNRELNNESNKELDKPAEQKARERYLQQKEELRKILPDYKFPDYLPMPFPVVDEKNNVSPPDKIRWNEFAELKHVALALQLQFIPLIDIPDLKIETREVLSYDNTTKLLDENRLAWEAVAVDEKSENKTPVPMFRFTMTESGLEVEWCSEGLQNLHLYDTVLSSLGFLSVYVNEEEMNDRITYRKIPLFVPKKMPPIPISHFAETPAIEVKTFLNEEPWKSVLELKYPPLTVRLDVNVNDPAAVRKKTEPANFAVEFNTETEHSQSVGDTANDTIGYKTISIPFEATADCFKIVWKDLKDEQIKKNKEELQINQDRQKELKTEMNLLQTEGFSSPSKENKERQTEVKNELKELEARFDTVKSLADNYPKAHNDVLADKERSFDYSLYLISGEKELLILHSK